MIGVCKEYLIQKLKDAGIKSKIHTSMKTLTRSNESHVGAVIFEEDKLVRSGSKTIYKDERGDKRKRTKIFDRDLSFGVVIGEYDDSKCEGIFEKFIALLEQGILIDGNYTGIEFDEAQWIDENDDILKAKVAVRVLVTFKGGLYKDTSYALMSDLEQTIEKKEDAYGDE